MIELILLERVEKLGQMGQLVKVKPGFARNYLLPQKKAMRATKENQAYFETQRAQRIVTEERRLTSIGFMEDGQFDYMSSKSERTFEKPVQWIALSQQFFNSTLIARNGSRVLAAPDATWTATAPAATSAAIVRSAAIRGSLGMRGFLHAESHDQPGQITALKLSLAGHPRTSWPRPVSSG